VAAIESGYMKRKLVQSNTQRLEAIERGEQIVVGVNRFTQSERSPLTDGGNSITVIAPEVESEQIARLRSWRAGRDEAAVQRALKELGRAAREGANIMEPSIEAAKAGVTTGEWVAVLRATFGEYRAPTGVSPVARQEAADLDDVRAEVERVSLKLGKRLKFLVGKPGLDGHSNGAEQIAVRATDAGMDVVYDGIRLTPAEIVERAKVGVHCVGLSILSGSHLAMAFEVSDGLRQAGFGHIPIVVGGIIPEADAQALRSKGIAAVYTPKDFAINRLIGEIVKLVDARTD
jgi:(2R)-ethylmalonyl-CoA mutase